MDAITKRFVIPIQPKATTKMPVVYPWENTNFYYLCIQLYDLARNSGYTETFEEFKAHFGAYLESGDTIIRTDEYTGQYTVTPLPNLEQILRTDNKVMRHDVTVEPIPFFKTSNDAGGYTVTIG